MVSADGRWVGLSSCWMPATTPTTAATEPAATSGSVQARQRDGPRYGSGAGRVPSTAASTRSVTSSPAGACRACSARLCRSALSTCGSRAGVRRNGFLMTPLPGHLDAQRRQAPADQAADRADPAAEGFGGGLVGEVLEVAQYECGALPLGQVAQAGPDLVAVGEPARRVVLVDVLGHVGVRELAPDGAAPLVDVAVGERAPHVGQRHVRALDVVPFGIEPDEGVLDEFLGGQAAAGEQVGGAHQGRRVRAHEYREPHLVPHQDLHAQ